MVAALYVDPKGVYSGLPDVEVWDEARDARKYAGPWPVVAHPPCARWSVLANIHGRIGEDDGCFMSALESFREFGGVLEHPANSMAWDEFGLLRPQRMGWTQDLFNRGWVCEVSQAAYGHKAPKLTWLLASTTANIKWDRPLGTATVQGTLGKRARAATPVPFRDLLLSIARSCA